MITKEDKKRYLEVKNRFQSGKPVNFTDSEKQEYRAILDLLCANDVLQDLQIDNANAYRQIGNFDIFEKSLSEHDNQERSEKRRSLWRDILMLAIGALFGGIITFVLFKAFGIG